MRSAERTRLTTLRTMTGTFIEATLHYILVLCRPRSSRWRRCILAALLLTSVSTTYSFLHTNLMLVAPFVRFYFLSFCASVDVLRRNQAKDLRIQDSENPYTRQLLCCVYRILLTKGQFSTSTSFSSFIVPLVFRVAQENTAPPHSLNCLIHRTSSFLV